MVSIHGHLWVRKTRSAEIHFQYNHQEQTTGSYKLSNNDVVMGLEDFQVHCK